MFESDSANELAKRLAISPQAIEERCGHGKHAAKSEGRSQCWIRGKLTLSYVRTAVALDGSGRYLAITGDEDT